MSENVEILTSNKQLNLDEIHNPAVESDEIESNITPEISSSKTSLILILESYQYSRFKDRIIHSNPEIFNNLHVLSEEQLQERIDSAKLLIQAKNNAVIVQAASAGITKSYEGFTKILGFNTTGLAEALTKNEDTLDIVEELRLKYFTTMYTETEVRLAGMLLSTTFLIDTMNNNNKHIINHLNSTVTNSSELENLI